jgi:hypothetical protein
VGVGAKIMSSVTNYWREKRVGISCRSAAKQNRMGLVGIFKSSVALKREEYHTSLLVHLFGMVLQLTISAADLIVGVSRSLMSTQLY